MEKKARCFFENAGIIIRDDEPIEVSDFGLDNNSLNSLRTEQFLLHLFANSNYCSS